MSQLVAPHGGVNLKPLLLATADDRAAELTRAATLTQVPMTSREVSDLVMLGMGAYTPLDGFMNQADWLSVCNDMRLADGTFWPIPITLSATSDLVAGLNLNEDVALVDAETGAIMAILNVGDIYRIDKALECREVYRTEDGQHPGVEKVLAQADYNLAGRLTTLSEGHFPATYPDLYLRPAETRKVFAENGWSKVAAFQTRNPMHRSHEHLAKIAVEVCDGLLIHQVLGALKPGDIPAEVRIDAINALVENYFVPGTVVQAGYPIEMRYAGPREALLHALFRQNFGCSHLVVGRDHAGVGSYYGPFDAHHIFDEIPAGALETEALKIDITFFCAACDGIATARTCPHDEDKRLNISGTRFREMLANDETVPLQFSRPEVIRVLKAYYANQS